MSVLALLSRGINAGNSRIAGSANLLSGDNATFEGGTVGDWETAALNNTVANSTAQARSGSRSMLCTFVDQQPNMFKIDSVPGPVANGVYDFKMWVYIPSANWNGGNIGVVMTNYSGSTENAATNSGGTTDAWVQISARTTLASDVTGNLVIEEIGGTPLNGDFFYVDDVSLVKVG